MESYRTIAGLGKAEVIIKKSRFIGRALPVETQQAAVAWISGLKTAHWDASHNVWAYALREGQLRRYSDDGEPQGTAGLPTLEVLQKEGLCDCAVVVTRYFGGTLLGAGGLVRAYTQAAKAAVEAAGLVTMQPCRVLRVRCDYGFYGRMQLLISACGCAVLETEFAEAVTLVLRIAEEGAEAFAAQVLEASSGTVCCQVLRQEFAAC